MSYLTAPAPEGDAFKPRNVLPVAPFRFGHVSGAALVSRPRYPDHPKQRSGLGLGEPQLLPSGCDFLGGRHGLILFRIQWKHKPLDMSVSIGYIISCTPPHVRRSR